MFSLTLKRSAATLGVVLAGLLAAAGPASAQPSPTSSGVKAPGVCANVSAQLSLGGAEAAGFVNGCAPGYVPVRQAGTEGVKAPATADLQTNDKAVVVLIGANDYGWTEGNDNPCCRDD